MKLLALISVLGLAPGVDDKEDLAKAARNAAQAESYAFKAETKLDGALANFGGREIPAMEGKYQKDVGTYTKLGERAQMFRKGERTFIKTPDGDWQDARDFRPQGGQPQRGAMMGRMLRGVGAPHEEAKVFENGLKEIKKAEAPEKIGGNDCSVYSGDLTEAAVKESPLGRMLGQLGGGQGVEMKGKGKAWVDAGGNLVRYELASTMSGEFGGNAFEFTMIRTFELSEVGKTQVEVPEAVKKLLEQKPAEKPEEKKEEKRKDF